MGLSSEAGLSLEVLSFKSVPKAMRLCFDKLAKPGRFSSGTMMPMKHFRVQKIRFQLER